MDVVESHTRGRRVNGRHTPPIIALRSELLNLEPPESLPVLVVLPGVFVGVMVVEMMMVDGGMGVASGSLPAAFATVASNDPFYTGLSST